MSNRDVASTFDDERLLAHHEAKMPERGLMIRDVGFEGVVLDAGCGLGQFSDLIATETGREIHCIDTRPTPAHAAKLGREHRQGEIRDLPYESNSLDGVWCANTLMYVDDPLTAIQEFHRVVKPSGIIAIKEEDAARDIILSWDPAIDIEVRAAWHSALRAGEIYGDGYMGRKVPGLVRRAGLEDVSIRSYLIERFAPFSPPFVRYIVQAFITYRELYERHLSAASFVALTSAMSSDNPDSFFADAGAYVICIETVVTARKLQKGEKN